MAGYIIELYKNIISNDESIKNDNENIKKNSYITFGDFDKMAVSKTTAFFRMRDMSELSRSWIGDRQTILLYELIEENKVIYKDVDGEEGFYFLTKEGEKKSEELFIAITILQFKNSPVEPKQVQQNILMLAEII